VAVREIRRAERQSVRPTAKLGLTMYGLAAAVQKCLESLCFQAFFLNMASAKRWRLAEQPCSFSIPPPPLPAWPGQGEDVQAKDQSSSAEADSEALERRSCLRIRDRGRPHNLSYSGLTQRGMQCSTNEARVSPT